MPSTTILNAVQTEQRIQRLAWQLYEDNYTEEEILLVGILQNGYPLAERIATVLRKIAPFRVVLFSLRIDKHSQDVGEPVIEPALPELQGKTVILVDDVLNSGKTLIYALKPFLRSDLRKLRTVVLVDRNHRRYPIAADFVGLSLATTMQEHVQVTFSGEGAVAELS
jgi:pyrimidine operon attenuation protein/uracil phosphoribosyltransferase